MNWGDYYKDKTTGEIIRYCPLHKGQQAVMDSKARFLFYIGGKYVGKSSFAPIWLIEEIKKHPRGRFIICSDSYNRLEQGVLPEFFKAIEHTEFGQVGGWKQGKHKYDLATGGVVYVRSLDDEESVNGIHANAIVVDEGLILKNSAWVVLESRVAGKLGRILVTSTPYKGKKWVQEFIDRAKDGDKNYFVWQGASTVNPFFTQDEFERLRRQLPPWRFEMDYCGLLTSPAGTIYPKMGDCVTEIQTLPSGRILGGVDIGHGGAPSAAVAGVLDSNDILWIFYELYCKPTNQESSYLGFAKALKSFSNNFYKATGRQVERWYCDSATDTWKSLRRYKIDFNDNGPTLTCRPAKKGAGSVDYGIDLVTARIQLGKLKIVKGNAPFILEEAENYRYDISEDDESSNVIKGADHALDALRYLIMSIDRRK